MAQPNENSEYISELKKLVNENVISEMTAQIHLSDFRKNAEQIGTPNLLESQQVPSSSPENFRNRRFVFVALILSLAAGIFIVLR